MQEGYYTEGDKLSVILFETESEQFAINIYDTKEIILAGQIRKLPQSYDFIDGIYNYRGEIIHIVNLSKKLNLNQYKIYNSKKTEEKYSSEKKYIIIVSVNNVNTGFLVDRILDIANVDIDLVESLSPIFQTSVGIEYIKGIIKFKDRPRILLDLSRILTEVEQTIMEKDQTITK